MNNPKILVGSPITSLKEYCIPDYIKGLKSLTYPTKQILVLDNSPPGKDLRPKFNLQNTKYLKTPHDSNVRKMLARERNFFKKKVLDEGFDYWLSLEQDVIPPANVIEMLLQNKKQIVSAAYFNFSHEKQNAVPQPNMFSLINPNDSKTLITRRLNFDDLWPSRLIKIFLMGFGCMLIHKSVLEQIDFRVEENLAAYDDVFFCRDAQEKGFELFLDSRVLCRHLNQPHNEELSRKLWSK